MCACYLLFCSNHQFKLNIDPTFRAILYHIHEYITWCELTNIFLWWAKPLVTNYNYPVYGDTLRIVVKRDKNLTLVLLFFQGWNWSCPIFALIAPWALILWVNLIYLYEVLENFYFNDSSVILLSAIILRQDIYTLVIIRHIK